MPIIKANGLLLEYEQFGASNDPTILLIMGLGTQMIAWSDTFCNRLSSEGFHVLRFDNRDIGLSQKFHGAKTSHLLKLLIHRSLGYPLPVPYTLEDMAQDTIELLDALHIQKAHIVGASMGGMIGQILTATHPHRVLSFTSMMSNSGNVRYMSPHTKILKHLLFSRPTSLAKKDVLEHAIRFWEYLDSPGFPMAPGELHRRVHRALSRSYYPPGVFRQAAAIIATGDRRRYLRKITTPTLVIHGDQDPLVPLRGGMDTAKNIPHSTFKKVEGMGHNFSPSLLLFLSNLILAHIQGQSKEKVPHPSQEALQAHSMASTTFA